MILNAISENISESRQNLNHIGVDPINRIQDDTYEKWASLGTGVAILNLTDTGIHHYWTCDEGGSFPSNGMLINCVSGSKVYQILFDAEKMLTRYMDSTNQTNHVWTSYATHNEIIKDVDQWSNATNSTNINTGSYVLYKRVGNEVRVRIADCTTKLEMTASTFSNKKLIATGLPVPTTRQFGVGMVGESIAYFFVEPSGDSNSGYLRFFGVSGTIASGTAIEASFSYIID